MTLPRALRLPVLSTIASVRDSEAPPASSRVPTRRAAINASHAITDGEHRQPGFGRRVVSLVRGVPYADWLEAEGSEVVRAESASAIGSRMVDEEWDVALLPLFTRHGCGMALAESIASSFARCRTLVVAPPGAQTAIARALRVPNISVISADLSRPVFLDTVLAGLKSTAACLLWLVEEISKKSRLSRQQERVLWLNLWGYPDQEIGHALGIQLHTVQDYQLALRRKTGVRSKAGYLRLLLENLGTPAPLSDAAQPEGGILGIGQR